MKSKLSIIVLVIVALGAVYYFSTQNKDTTTLKEEMSSTSGDEVADDNAFVGDESEDSFRGDIKSLIARNIPMKCSYSAEGNSYEGWIKGTSMRADYKSPEGEGSVIIKDNCMHTWLSGETQGFSTCMQDSTENIWDEAETKGNIPNDFNCRPAIIDDSAFDLPADIEFVNFDSLMQDAKKYMEN